MRRSIVKSEPHEPTINCVSFEVTEVSISETFPSPRPQSPRPRLVQRRRPPSAPTKSGAVYDGDLALPSSVDCKLSSEAVGYVTMSPVRRERLDLKDLVARILGVCGKNPARIATVLARGSLVSGDIRYRWPPLNVTQPDLAALLEEFPDHDLQRVFDPRLCRRMIFAGQRGEFEIDREAGLQKRLFRRKSFWEEALGLIAPLSPRCQRYSYSEEADVFSVRLPTSAVRRLRGLGGLLRYSSLQTQVQSLQAPEITLHVPRP